MKGSAEINLEGDILASVKQLTEMFQGLDTRISGVEQSATKGFDSIKKSLSQINLVSITQGFKNLTDSLDMVNGPGLTYEKSMADLSAITGQTGKALDNLGSMARQNAKDFGGDAAKSVETYKLLLSQLGPGLAETPKLLNEMARSAETLGKTMGGDTVAATQVLTTAMNQYGVDTSNPIEATKTLNEMMNAMAASAKEGSSELPTLQAAVNVVGGDAKRAKVSFNEMLASIQLLDKGGKKGAEGGIALRNVLSTLNKGRFLPQNVQEELRDAKIDVEALSDKSLSLTDRLRILKPVAGDAALMSALFGQENQGAAQILVNSADAQDEMTRAITGTSTAFDQASVIMETTEEKRARMIASIEDAKIAFFELTNGATAYLSPIAEIGTLLTGFAPVVSLVNKGLKSLGIGKHFVTAAQWLWNAALNANPISLIIAGIAALTVAVYAVTKAFNTSSAAEQANTEIKQRAMDKSVDERVELDLLFSQLKKTNEGTEERKRLMSELNEKYPDILGKYDLEKMSLEDINDVQKEIIQNINKRAEAEAALEILKETKKARQELESSGVGIVDLALAGGNSGVAEINRQRKIAELRQKEQAVMDKLSQDRLEEMKSNQTEGKKTESTPTEAVDESPAEKEKLAMTEEAINAEIKRLKDQKATAEIGSKEYKGFERDIASLERKLGKNPFKSKSFSGGEEKKMKSLTVTIGTLVNNLNITQATRAESIAEARDKVMEALTGAVRDFEASM